MLKISKLYENIKSEGISVEKVGDLYNLQLNGTMVKENLENIFIYGDNLFILVSKGKFGAVQYDDNLNEIQSLPCVYDTLDEYWHNLVFSKNDEVVYYNAASKDWIPLLDIYEDNHFVYGEDEETYLIIEQATGKLIWREYKNRKRLIDKPCFAYCGKEDANPVFFDITNGHYITKMPEGYARYNKPPLVKPIIVNGENIVNISERNNKLGIIDTHNRKSIVPQWNEVNVELKITLKSGKDELEKVFNVTEIKAGDCVPVEEW